MNVQRRKLGIGSRAAYLHDELDRTNEVTEKLEDQVLFFFLHLIETILLSSGSDLSLGETNAGVSLQHLLRHWTSATSDSLLLFLEILSVTVLRLEIVDQRIHVLVVFLLGRSLFTGRNRVSAIVVTDLLRVVVPIELTTGDGVAKVVGRGGAGARGIRVPTVVSTRANVGHCWSRSLSYAKIA